jgi:hypothetical protein
MSNADDILYAPIHDGGYDDDPAIAILRSRQASDPPIRVRRNPGEWKSRDEWFSPAARTDIETIRVAHAQREHARMLLDRAKELYQIQLQKYKTNIREQYGVY